MLIGISGGGGEDGGGPSPPPDEPPQPASASSSDIAVEMSFSLAIACLLDRTCRNSSARGLRTTANCYSVCRISSRLPHVDIASVHP